MRRFLLKIFGFIFGLILFILAPIIFLSKYDNTDKNQSINNNIISLRSKSNYDSLDILFIGNSYCYSSINTLYFDSLNISTYNLGIASAGVNFYEILIFDYINNISKLPKKVLILVSPMTFSNKADNFATYPIHRYLDKPFSHFEVALKFNLFDKLGEMYKGSIKKVLKNSISVFYPISNKKKQNEVYKGYFPKNGILSKEVIKKTEFSYLDFQTEKWNSNKFSKLLNLAAILEKKEIEVIFFEVPTNDLESYFNSDYLEQYHQSLSQIKANYIFFSVNKELFTSKNYRNIDHMNPSGAKIATSKIIQALDSISKTTFPQALN